MNLVNTVPKSSYIPTETYFAISVRSFVSCMLPWYELVFICAVESLWKINTARCDLRNVPGVNLIKLLLQYTLNSA